MRQFKVNYQYISKQEIIDQYYLLDFCDENSSQLSNIALAIQNLYYKEAEYRAVSNYNRELCASICRDILINTFSALDGIIICLSKKIQKKCKKCLTHCAFFADTMMTCNKNAESKTAFLYLEKIGVLTLDKKQKDLYFDLKKLRNTIHTNIDTMVYTNNEKFNIYYVEKVINFFQNIVETLRKNYLAFNCKGTIKREQNFSFVLPEHLTNNPRYKNGEYTIGNPGSHLVFNNKKIELSEVIVIATFPGGFVNKINYPRLEITFDRYNTDDSYTIITYNEQAKDYRGRDYNYYLKQYKDPIISLYNMMMFDLSRLENNQNINKTIKYSQFSNLRIDIYTNKKMR